MKRNKMNKEEFMELIHKLIDSPEDLLFMAEGYLDGLKDIKNSKYNKSEMSSQVYNQNFIKIP